MAFALCLALGGVGLWRKYALERTREEFFTSDAVCVIALDAANCYLENPSATQGELERRILNLHYASVINLKVDTAGRPTDRFGTVFRIHRSGSSVTATSAGRDRAFDTNDDIVYSTGGPLPEWR
jgi:hypothetical protein